MVVEIAREELYRLVWTHPRTELARRFGISDVALAHACAAADVPMPGRGHWAKVSAGRIPRPTPLPPRGFGERQTLVFGDPNQKYSPPKIEDDIPLPPEPHFDEPMETVSERALDQTKRSAKSIKSKQVHGSIQRNVLAVLAKRAAKGWIVDGSPFDGRNQGVLNGLIWTLEPVARCTFHFGADLGRIRVSIGATSHLLTFDSDKGKLRLRLSDVPEGWPLRTAWVDGPKRLEDQLAEIAADLIIHAEATLRAAAKQHYDWAVRRRYELRQEPIRRAEEAARRDEERLQREREARRGRLIGHAESLAKATQIRGLVQAVMTAHAGSDHAELNEWAAWAESEATAIDPRNLSVQQLIT